jgi:acyl-CoA-binding protein
VFFVGMSKDDATKAYIAAADKYAAKYGIKK